MVKNPLASARDTGHVGSIPGLGRSPGEGNGNPLQYSCLGNSMGERNLAGYSPWGRKESDTTEQLSTNIDTGHSSHSLSFLHSFFFGLGFVVVLF